jgi:hypothetical protein
VVLLGFRHHRDARQELDAIEKAGEVEALREGIAFSAPPWQRAKIALDLDIGETGRGHAGDSTAEEQSRQCLRGRLSLN